MNKPAAFLGTYVDLKFLSGLKVARVTLEIPIERSQEFIGMFGTPNKADPAWCALARIDVAALNAPSVPEKSVEPAKVEKAETKRSNLAAIMLKENTDFQNWLVDTYWNGKEEVGDYDGLLKRVLQIASKKELDTSASKAIAWDALLCDFDVRNTVRA